MATVATTTPAASVEGATGHGPANKRLRDEQDSSDPSDENTEDMDQASFTVVSYKKKRGTGVPVVFRPTKERGSLWKVNPNVFASAVVTSAQEKVLNHRLNKDGSLMVTVSTLPAANRLLTVTQLAGVAVEARVPYSYTANYVKIQDVPLSYANEDLRDYLRDQGVVSAKRLTTFTPEDGGKVKELSHFLSSGNVAKRLFMLTEKHLRTHEGLAFSHMLGSNADVCDLTVLHVILAQDTTF
ncbi:hypothetical protein MTO96_028310 [Rhipicephalus appendiculatus]